MLGIKISSNAFFLLLISMFIWLFGQPQYTMERLKFDVMEVQVAQINYFLPENNDFFFTGTCTIPDQVKCFMSCVFHMTVCIVCHVLTRKRDVSMSNIVYKRYFIYLLTIHM